MEELKQIIQEIKGYTFIKPDDSTILECATRIFISNNIARKNGQKQVRLDEPATEKQVKLLKKMQIKIPEGLTKKEASLLIDETITKQKDESNY
ncbi:hypothetical protein M0R04_09745 [Candidatus Dojkabacteria bacterium]|jgi:hypothetical protein|nr:hypothetical protein [Candidatus Dojkabacteria bacterium]